jgi:alpha/beta superfamily hydrolase
LRFDFTGNGHSSGDFHYSNYDEEQRDLREVVEFVQTTMKCKVLCLVGHSKGAYAIFRYALEHADDGSIPAFVELSGRFSTPNDYNVRSKLTPTQYEALQRQGRVILGKRGDRVLQLSQKDVDERMSLDSSFVRQIQKPVLIIHGSADEMVDVSNAHKFAQYIPTNELHIIEKADHNYNGLRHMDELTSTIAAFLQKHCRNEL